MYDLIRKGMLTGIGLALKTWDEVEALAKELEKRVEKSVNEFLKRADIVTGDELKGLKKEIRELKKMISNQNA